MAEYNNLENINAPAPAEAALEQENNRPFMNYLFIVGNFEGDVNNDAILPRRVPLTPRGNHFENQDDEDEYNNTLATFEDLIFSARNAQLQDPALIVNNRFIYADYRVVGEEEPVFNYFNLRI